MSKFGRPVLGDESACIENTALMIFFKRHALNSLFDYFQMYESFIIEKLIEIQIW